MPDKKKRRSRKKRKRGRKSGGWREESERRWGEKEEEKEVKEEEGEEEFTPGPRIAYLSEETGHWVWFMVAFFASCPWKGKKKKKNLVFFQKKKALGEFTFANFKKKMCFSAVKGQQSYQQTQQHIPDSGTFLST